MMTTPQSAYAPDFSAETVQRRLRKLLNIGSIKDNAVLGWVSRLEKKFQTYISLYPHGLWTSGVAVTGEMRSLTELYLPLDDVRTAFLHLHRRALKFDPGSAAPLDHWGPTWLDVLPHLPRQFRLLNPAKLLLLIAEDEVARSCFIFSLHLPERHGGAFGRYPAQMKILVQWLTESSHLFPRIRCLDAACGSGEGTYELAMMLSSARDAVDWEVHGLSLDPLEIFAAAHGCFLHDSGRGKAFRRQVEPLLTGNLSGRIAFSVGDVTLACKEEEEAYEVVVCNGLLGGPLLHASGKLRDTVASLASRLKPGGLFLVADRFHGGWAKRVPKEQLRELFNQHGVSSIDTDDGFAGIKKRPSLTGAVLEKLRN